jgi:hypothetical protein
MVTGDGEDIEVGFDAALKIPGANMKAAKDTPQE